MAKKAKPKKPRASVPAVYKVIEIVGTSRESWSDAASNAIQSASKSLRDLRVAEVDKLDAKVEGTTLVYRAKLKVSFKYHGDD
jgi:flavin-binding protein dodecin